MKLQKILINFIPIVLIFLLATYTPQFASFSQSSLGRLLAILLILFYLKLDFLTGLFVCVLVIVYYQTDYVEGFSQMLNEVKQENMENGPESEDPAKKETVALPPSQPQSRTEPLEPFSSYSPLNVDKPDNLILYDKSRQEFRKKHCQKGHLMHKGEIVKTEMSQHIFPEIKQDDFHKCNICDPSCSFEIIENYIRTEEDLMKPTSARVGGRE
jgi:hypothetical protein